MKTSRPETSRASRASRTASALIRSNSSSRKCLRELRPVRAERVRLDQLGARADVAEVDVDDALGRAEVRLLRAAQARDRARESAPMPPSATIGGPDASRSRNLLIAASLRALRVRPPSPVLPMERRRRPLRWTDGTSSCGRGAARTRRLPTIGAASSGTDAISCSRVEAASRGAAFRLRSGPSGLPCRRRP